MATVVTVVTVAALAAAVGGCGDWNRVGAGPARRTTTAAFSTVPATPGPELARMWAAHSLPCDHPVGVRERPADPYQLLKTGIWPTSVEVASRLSSATATGGPEFILGRLRVLGAVVLQTQSEIAEQVTAGTGELARAGDNAAVAAVVRDQHERTIRLRRDNYDAAVDHVIGELRLGTVLPSAQIGRRFRLERVCPHR